jgi:hypothetical protein
MCISAPVSFGATVVLSAAGIIALKRVKDKKQILLATLPLFFAMQQFSEGILWVSMSVDSLRFLKQPAIYTFLSFAEVLWPIAVPLAIYFIEPNTTRKRILLCITGLGTAFSIHLIYCLFNYEFGVVLKKNHIFYTQSFPDTFVTYSAVVYIITTIISAFVSSKKPVHSLGIVILTSFLITKFLFDDALISVWCFFAALGSISVTETIRKLNDPKKEELKVEIA